jgi:hypothetical protein
MGTRREIPAASRVDRDPLATLVQLDASAIYHGSIMPRCGQDRLAGGLKNTREDMRLYRITMLPV